MLNSKRTDDGCRDVLNALFWRRLNLDDGLRQRLSELPGTKNLASLALRAGALSDVRVSCCQIPAPRTPCLQQSSAHTFHAQQEAREAHLFGIYINPTCRALPVMRGLCIPCN